MNARPVEVRIVFEPREQLVLFAAALGKAGMAMTAAAMETARRQQVRNAFNQNPTTQDERNNDNG